MARRNNKPIAFRIYPDHSKLYIIVKIWPTRALMVKRSRQIGHKGSGIAASFTQQHCYNPKNLTISCGLFGEVNFYRRYISITPVTHEMTHATLAWAARKHLDLNSFLDTRTVKQYHANPIYNLCKKNGEERFCEVLASLCAKFTAKCYALGLYQEVVAS